MAGGSTLDKALGLLDLLEEAETPLPFEALHARLGFPRSTLYRYLKALADAGLVASLHERGFVLGPRIAELDRAMRLHDPLIAAARAPMAALAEEMGGVALLCRRYRDRVLCVHQEGTMGAEIRSTYVRGLAMPLFRGAASRVILAHLPSAMVARLRARQPAEFERAGIGPGTLRAIRRQGFDMTQGQVTAGVTGIAAPLLDSGGAVLGSLSVTLPRREVPREAVEEMAARIAAAARDVTRASTQIPNNET